MFFKQRVNEGWNPLLSLGKEEFISAVTASIPPRPGDMERLVAANLGLQALG